MSDLNPVEYGRLLAKVEGLEAKVSSMDSDIKTLLALANQSKGGFWMDAVRNTLGDWLSPENDSGFVGGLEKKIEDKICGYWNKATGNAKNVLTKLKGEESKQPQVATTSPTTAPTTPSS